jgi:hypothetical protein
MPLSSLACKWIKKYLTRGPSVDWWVLTTANAALTNGLTWVPKHGGARDNKFLVPHPMTSQLCLTSAIARRSALTAAPSSSSLYFMSYLGVSIFIKFFRFFRNLPLSKCCWNVQIFWICFRDELRRPPAYKGIVNRALWAASRRCARIVSDSSRRRRRGRVLWQPHTDNCFKRTDKEPAVCFVLSCLWADELRASSVVLRTCRTFNQKRRKSKQNVKKKALKKYITRRLISYFLLFWITFL